MEEDAEPQKQRKATCIEVLLFIIWYFFVALMVDAQYQTNGYQVASAIRDELIDKPFSSEPVLAFGGINNPSSFQLWAEKVYVPFVVGNKNPEVTGSLETDCTSTPYSIWGWNAACTRSSRFSRAGPIMFWQVGTNQLPIKETSTGNQYDYTTVDSNYEYDGLYKPYKPDGYFRLWETDITYDWALQDIKNMGCTQACSCKATYDSSFSSCFGCGCETVLDATSNSSRNSFYNTQMTSAFTMVTTLVNNGRVVVLSIMFETKEPQPGLRWEPSYMVFSPQAPTLGYFVLVYLIMCVFLVFSIKQVKDSGFRYLGSLWNIFDIVNLTLFLVGLVWAVIFMTKYDKFTATDASSVNEDTIIHMMNAGKWQQLSMTLFGVNQLIMNIKLIKYIQALEFIPGLAMPVAALQEAGIEMMAFMVTLLIICYGFAQTFTAWFGDQFSSYRNVSTSFTTLMLALTGYPDFNELGAETLQTEMQEAGLALLSLYCFFFIFFFLVMLVAIQHVAYNKVRGAFLRAGTRILTAAQMCKLMRKRYRFAKAEVGQAGDDPSADTFQGSWWRWFKFKAKIYWKDNFTDFSEGGAGPEDDGQLGDGGPVLNQYEQNRLDNQNQALDKLDEIRHRQQRIDQVLMGVDTDIVVVQATSLEANSSDEEDEADEEQDDERQKEEKKCFGLCRSKRSSKPRIEMDVMAEQTVNPAAGEAEDAEERPEFITGDQVYMAEGAADGYLGRLEEIDSDVRSLVEKQQQQQANILKSCDEIVSVYSSRRLY